MANEDKNNDLFDVSLNKLNQKGLYAYDFGNVSNQEVVDGVLK